MICYAFAVAHEGKDLVENLNDREFFSLGPVRCVVGKLGGRTVLVAFMGMGLTNAANSTRIILDYFRLKCFILAGYGGALVPQLKKGQVILSDNYTSEAVLPFVRLLSGFDFAKTCSTDEIVATPERKAQYARELNVQVVDMETSAVAELVHAREMPFIALRAISDEAQETLPVGALTAGYDPIQNKATPFKLLIHLAKNRQEIAPFRHFLAGLPLARQNLTKFILDLTEELPKHW